MDVDRRREDAGRVGDARGHGAEALGELPVDPGVAVEPDPGQALAQRVGVDVSSAA